MVHPAPFSYFLSIPRKPLTGKAVQDDAKLIQLDPQQCGGSRAAYDFGPAWPVFADKSC